MLGPRVRPLVAPVGIAAVLLFFAGILAVARYDDARVSTQAQTAGAAARNGPAASGHAPQPPSNTDSNGTDGSIAPGDTTAGSTDGAAGSSPTTAAGGASDTTTVLDAPTTVPPSGSGVVGYAGCSQTEGAVVGYEMNGGSGMWPDVPYGGGTVQHWADNIAPPGGKLREQWATFAAQQQKQPASVIWWQLCTKAAEDDAGNAAAAPRVRDELLRLSPPGTVIYVSAQNFYVAPHVCDITGKDGPARMQALADQLVAQGLARRGPDVGSLHSKYETPSQPPGDETDDDGCHPNPAGKHNVLGPPLLQFFG